MGNEGRQHGIIPVHTPKFSFPNKSFYESELPWRHTSDDFHTFFSEDDLASALKELFNKISMNFATNASKRVLKAQSRDVLVRIPTKHIVAFEELQKVCRLEPEQTQIVKS